jgi:hypothetical protein
VLDGQQVRQGLNLGDLGEREPVGAGTRQRRSSYRERCMGDTGKNRASGGQGERVDGIGIESGFDLDVRKTRIAHDYPGSAEQESRKRLQLVP